MRIAADVRSSHPAEWICRAIVQVQAVGLNKIPCQQVQVAVPVHIAHGNRICVVRITADIRTSNPTEWIRSTVVQVQAVDFVLIPCQQV